jgi:hypothetical protein
MLMTVPRPRPPHKPIATTEASMRYLMLHFFDEDVLASLDNPEMDREINAWVSEAESSGAKQFGAALRPSAQGKTVRIREGSLLVTDGPFAETKEQVAGIDILECDSIDEAIALAARHPSARTGTLEIRQFSD